VTFERTIALETPGVEADGDVIGEHVGAGKGEIDQTGHPLAEKEHVVRKQIGVDHALRQIPGPDIALEMIELGANKGRAARAAPSSAREAAASNSGRQPDTDSALARDIGKIRTGQMHLRQGLADPGAVRHVGLGAARCLPGS